MIDNRVQLACDDPWVAKAMARRPRDPFFALTWLTRHDRVADGLVRAYDKALAGEEACDGVKQLDETTMNSLCNIVEQSRSQDRSGN